MNIETALYRGPVPDTGFTSSYSGRNLHLILSGVKGTNQAEGSDIAVNLGRLISAKEMNSLSEFEQAVAAATKEQNVSFNVSVAAAYQNGSVVYLKTIDTGTIFLRRNNELVQIIGEDKSASGYLREGDTFILTDARSVKSITIDVLKKASSLKTVEGMASLEENIPGTIALFIHSSGEVSLPIPQKNTITIVLVSLITIAFVWSVFLGYQRRAEAEIQKKIQTSKEIIEQKLHQAEDVAFLNRARSQTLIGEAKTELQNLKNSLPASRATELVTLEQALLKREAEISDRKEKKAEEFFDLTVDSKDAKGTRLSLHQGVLAILNPEGEKIYLLSLEKKSLDKIEVSNITNNTLITLYEDELYLYEPKKGITRLYEGKPNQAVKHDSDWGTIAGIETYNGMVYLLDKTKKLIYRYAKGDAGAESDVAGATSDVAGAGFGSKILYNKDDGFSLHNPHSFAIDSSIYIADGSQILKYTAGLPDAFSTEYPENDITVSKVITSADLEKVYVWDKSNSALYVLGKNGAYERQIGSRMLKDGSDVVVYGSNAYILRGAKIYSVEVTD